MKNDHTQFPIPHLGFEPLTNYTNVGSYTPSSISWVSRQLWGTYKKLKIREGKQNFLRRK